MTQEEYLGRIDFLISLMDDNKQYQVDISTPAGRYEHAITTKQIKSWNKGGGPHRLSMYVYNDLYRQVLEEREHKD